MIRYQIFQFQRISNADIGEQVAAERALKIVIGKRFNASNSKVIV